MKKTITLLTLGALILFSGFNSAIGQNNPGQIVSPCVNHNVDPALMQANIDNYQPTVYRSSISMPEGWEVENLIPVNRARIDNKGTEFWLMMPRNHDLVVTGIYLDITSDLAATGFVEIPGLSFYEAFNATPGTITRITLPSDVQVASSESIEYKGIHIVSDQEVAVYGVSLRTASSDGYLALPLDILANQYLLMSYPNLTWFSGTVDPTLISQIGIVSPYDNVTVTITPSCATYNGQPAGVPFSVVLNRGEAYQVQCLLSNDPSADLTGTVIQSSLPVAAFAGNACASIPQNTPACDHIVEQVPPVSTWGSYFVAFPLQGRENGDTWRMLSASNGTNLFIDGSLVATLNFGDFYETILTSPAEISASNPVLVMQYSNGDDWDPNFSQNGDPFMMLIPPSEQFMDHYTFATPSAGFTYHYVTVTIPTAGIATLQLDGTPVDPALFTSIGTTGYSGAGIAITEGSHTLVNTGGTPFGIYSYGFASYDSYGYAGGLSLEIIYSGSAPVIHRTQETINLGNQGQLQNVALTIAAEITDPETPFTQSATLYYRKASQTGYTTVPMTDQGGNIWSAQIPANDVLEPGVFYYIYATDGQLGSTDPTIDPGNNPYGIAVLPNVLPVITHTPVTTAPLNQPVTINAEITDITNYVAQGFLYYRNKGGNPVYDVANMNLVSGSTYQGVIPAQYITDQGTEYYLKAVDDFGMSSTFGTPDIPLVINSLAGIDDPGSVSSNLSIYPNPANGNATFEISVQANEHWTLKVYNILGAEVFSIEERISGSESFKYDFDGSGLPQGCYFVNLKHGDQSEVQKLILSH